MIFLRKGAWVGLLPGPFDGHVEVHALRCRLYTLMVALTRAD